jgi:hypothetical protein
MGSSHSYVTDPDAFATKVKETDDKSSWKSYDYVVVGGGAFHDGLVTSRMTMNSLTNETSSRHCWLSACIASLRGSKRVGPLN